MDISPANNTSGIAHQMLCVHRWSCCVVDLASSRMFVLKMKPCMSEWQLLICCGPVAPGAAAGEDWAACVRVWQAAGQGCSTHAGV